MPGRKERIHMTFKWYGNSCFLITTDSGTRILTDPCDPSTGYPEVHDIEADIVTVSHEHFDHNYTEAVKGEPVILRGAGVTEVNGITFTGCASWHDEVQGAKRGPNTVFIIEADGLRIVHLGDLGHMPDEQLYAAIGKPDVLLTPVGGTFTVDAQQAGDIARRTDATVIIPMHFKTPVLSFDIAGVDPFLKVMADHTRHRLLQPELSLSAAAIGPKRVLVLDYVR